MSEPLLLRWRESADGQYAPWRGWMLEVCRAPDRGWRWYVGPGDGCDVAGCEPTAAAAQRAAEAALLDRLTAHERAELARANCEGGGQ